jgi:hypothetical protein
MREVLATARSLTKEDIKQAVGLSVHTCGGLADEWREHADALSEGEGRDKDENEDADVSQMTAEARREIDEERAQLLPRP